MNIHEKCMENLENIPLFYDRLINDKKKFEIEIKQKQLQLEELKIDADICKFKFILYKY